MHKQNEKNDYIGTAGQLSVMAEFAYRGYNVAIPEIDKGDDIFVFNDITGEVWRVQVKTASPRKHIENSLRYQFNVRETAIATPQNPDLHFIFVMKSHITCRYFIIARHALQSYTLETPSLGSPSKDRGKNRRVIDFILRSDGQLIGKKKDLSKHLDDWSAWPNLISNNFLFLKV